MKYIDFNNWERKEHFKYFNAFDYPQFNVCANVNINKFYKHIKSNDLPFFISFLYIASKAANEVKELRYRIRGENVVEHESVDPSITVMTESGLFSYCAIEYKDNYSEFRENASILIENAKKKVSLEDVPERDDLLYVTSLPWVSFTGITHPIHMHPTDSFPRLAWGKYFENNGEMTIPFSLQAHHALVDGVHVGNFYNNLENYINSIEKYL